MKSKRYVNKIFKVLSETIKNPTTELNYSDEFTLLVAVVLSAQSTDKGVNKVTTKLFNLAKNPSEMVKLGEKKIRETIKNIPLDRILVETDSPYLSPEPVRGGRNEPANVVHTADYLADFYNIEKDLFYKKTTNNFHKLFNKAEIINE